MKPILHLLLFMGAVTGLRAELPIALPLDKLPPTNRPPGIVVPEPTRGGSVTNDVPVGREELPTPQATVDRPKNKLTYYDARMVPTPRATVDRLKLRNNDSFDGRFLGWEGGVVRWDAAAAARPIRFPEAGIASLTLAVPTNAPAPAAGEWLVRLTNGDLVTGDGLTMTADTVELATSPAGCLRLPRATVETVQRNRVQGFANFRALQWLGDWDRVSVDFPDKEQSIYRDVGLPNCVGVELLIPAPSTGRRLWLHLFCGGPSRLNTDPYYIISLYNNSLNIQTKGGLMMGGGMPQPLSLRSAQGRNTLLLGVLVNRLTGQAVLMVDGVVQQTVQLVPLLAPSGRGILVTDSLPGEPGPSWLLLTPLAEDLQVATPKAGSDAVQFANGDVMEGRLESLGATNLVLSGKLGRVELPAKRLLAARLAPAQRTEPRRREGDMAVTLRDGSRLTAVLREFGEEKLVLESELFGKLDLARSLVAELQGGLYDPPTAPVPNPNRVLAGGETSSAAIWEAGTIDLAGDLRLRGSLAGFADGIVSWQHPLALEPIQFRQSHVNRVTLLDSTADSLPAAATVKLTNSDRLSGELVAVDGRTVQLRPAYLPALSVPRAMVAAIRPNLTPEGVLDLAGSPTWRGSGQTPQITVTNNTVFFNPGASGQGLIREAFIREAPLPSRLCLQFDLVSQDRGRNFQITAFGRSQGGNLSEGCVIGFKENSVNLYALGPIVKSKSEPYHPDSARHRITATVLIDREQRDMFVFVEGRLLAQWRGTGALPSGNQLWFAVPSGQPVQLQRLMLNDWRGTLAALTNPVPATADSLLMHDMTRVTGTLTAVRDGQVYFTGDAGTTVQGLGRVNEIGFNRSQRDQPRRRDGDIVVQLSGGDQLTLSAARWDNTGLLGTSGAIGPVAVPGPAIARVEFRPYDPPAKTAPINYYGGSRLGNVSPAY